MAMISRLLWLALFTTTHATDPKQEYPYPRIVIMGQSGVGKSSLGNVLAGCQPSNEEEECFFPVCSGSDSCTSETSIAQATYLGKWGTETYGEVTLVDTPGFGDSSGDDTPLLANMIEVLKNTLGDANLILICQKENGRFSPSTITMLLELESMFGRERLWDNVMIEVTQWAYDSKSIADRERQGITEENTLKDINDHIMEIAHLPFPLEGIFLDSYATYYQNDEVQQSYFNMYAKRLWEKANSLPNFAFYTIEDILGQLDDCRAKNDCLNDVLANNITELAAMVAANSVAIVEGFEDTTNRITDLTEVVNDSKNTLNHVQDDLNTIGGRVDDNVNTLKNVKDDLNTVSGRVDDNLNTLNHVQDDVNTVSGRVAINEMTIKDMVLAPTGTVTAWLGGKTITIPNGWQKCDGSPILDGPMKGTHTPNLNGEELFLRGGVVTASWTVQQDQVVDHYHAVNDPGHTHRDGGHGHTDRGHKHTDSGHIHYDSGHAHMYLSTNWHQGDYDTEHVYRNPDDWNHQPQGHMPSYNSYANIQSAEANIQEGYSSITNGQARISTDQSKISVMGVSAASAGTETRPKNMVVEWIIKIE